MKEQALRAVIFCCLHVAQLSNLVLLWAVKELVGDDWVPVVPQPAPEPQSEEPKQPVKRTRRSDWDGFAAQYESEHRRNSRPSAASQELKRIEEQHGRIQR